MTAKELPWTPVAAEGVESRSCRSPDEKKLVFAQVRADKNGGTIILTGSIVKPCIISPVPAAESPSPPMEIAIANTVPMSAISVHASKDATSMNEDQFKRETLYQATMNMFQSMLREGVITREQYTIIDTRMLQKYRPLLGTLFSESRCNVLPLEQS